MLYFVLPLTLAFGSSDQVSIVHCNPGGPSLRLEVHEPFDGWSLSQPTASDKKFFRTAGARPVRFVFGADVDGDGYDEVVVIQQRTKKADRYELRVHAAPKSMGKDVGKALAIADKNALGAPSTHGKIVCAASADFNRDGVDEVTLVRQSTDGRQWLEVHVLSPGKKLGVDLISSITELGHYPFDAVQRMTAIDLDGNGSQEIALVRGAGDKAQRLQVIRPPAFIDDQVSVPYVDTDLVVGPKVLAIESSNIAGGFDSLIFVVPSGEQSSMWLRFANPSSLDLASFPEAHGEISGTPEHFFVLHGPGAPLSDAVTAAELAGEYSATFSDSIPIGYYEIIHDDVSLDGLSIDVEGVNTELSLPDGQSLAGEYSHFFKVLAFASKTIVIESDGVTLELDLDTGHATSFGGNISIDGTYSGIRKEGSSSLVIPTGKFSLTKK